MVGCIVSIVISAISKDVVAKQVVEGFMNVSKPEFESESECSLTRDIHVLRKIR